MKAKALSRIAWYLSCRRRGSRPRLKRWISRTMFAVGMTGPITLFEKPVALRQLPGIPESQLVPHGLLGDLVLGQGLDELVVHQEAVDIEDFVGSRIRGLEYRGTPAFRIFDTGEYRLFYQFRFVLELLHSCTKPPG